MIVAVPVVVVPMVVVKNAVQEPRADPVHYERRNRDDQHDPRTRLSAAVKLEDRFSDDLRGRGQNEHRVEDPRDRLRPAHPERKAGGRAPDRDAHGDQADRQGEHVHEEVKGVRLKNHAPRDERPRKLEAEEGDNDREDGREPLRLARLPGSELPGPPVRRVRMLFAMRMRVIAMEAVLVGVMIVRGVVCVTRRVPSASATIR
jgi:hypothetical protein